MRLQRLHVALAAVIVVVLVFPGLYAALMPEPRAPLSGMPVPPAGEYRVFVADWGYHTAVVVEQPRGWQLGPPRDERAPFLEYAWGDRRFFMESNYWPHAVFATLILPTASVVYLAGHPDPPRFAGARAVLARTVSASTVHALLTELERSIHRTPDGARVTALAPASGYRGRFYSAYGDYLWTRNCNWWIVTRLEAAGLAANPAGVVFTIQVPRRLRGFARVPQPN